MREDTVDVRVGGLELLEDARISGDARTRWSADYLAPLLREGPRHFIDNADVRLRVARCDDHLVPLVVSSKTRDNAEICDLRAHYVHYAPMNFRRRGRPWAARWSRVRNLPAALLMSFGGLDRAVYVDNHLFSTNPGLRLEARQLRALTAVLVEAYPDHLLLVRSVHPSLHRAAYDALLETGFRMTRSRTVHLFDPGSSRVSQRTNWKLDRKLLERTRYRAVTDRDRLVAAAPRLAELYRSLYLGKHPSSNPALNGRFFAHVLSRPTWEFVAFEADGSIDAFTSWFVDGGWIVGASVGHDLSRSQSLGLYRLGMAYLLEQARQRGMPVNLSSGADDFKRSRGSRATPEFDAIYDRHLSWRSRAAVTCLRTASNRHLERGVPGRLEGESPGI